MTEPITELTFKPAAPRTITDGVLFSVAGPVEQGRIEVRDAAGELKQHSPEFGQNNRDSFEDFQTVRITMKGSPAGGTYKLRVYDRLANHVYGETTTIAYNASAATIKSRLETLVGVGNVDVTGSGPYAIVFKGPVSAKYVSVAVSNNSLTGGTNPAPSMDNPTQEELGGVRVAGGPYLWGPIYLADGESSVADVVSTGDFPDDGIYNGDSLLADVVVVYDFGDL